MYVQELFCEIRLDWVCATGTHGGSCRIREHAGRSMGAVFPPPRDNHQSRCLGDLLGSHEIGYCCYTCTSYILKLGMMSRERELKGLLYATFIDWYKIRNILRDMDFH